MTTTTDSDSTTDWPDAFEAQGTPAPFAAPAQPPYDPAAGVAVELNDLISELGEAQRLHAQALLDLDHELAGVRDKHAPLIQSWKADVDRLTARVFDHFSVSHHTLLKPDDRTVRLPAGDAGLRISPVAVQISGKTETVVQALKAAGKDWAVGIEEVVNKAAILARKDPAAEVAGVRGIKVTQDEVLWVRPHATDAEVGRKAQVAKTDTLKPAKAAPKARRKPGSAASAQESRP